MTPAQIAAKPADNRTPIEQAIDKLQTINGWYEDDGPHWVNVDEVEDMLAALLPAEREQIERAYIQGDIDSCTESVNGHYMRDYKDFKVYITQTYGTP